MKIKRTTTNKQGREVVTVELAPGEKLLAVKDDYHYKLGYPVEDVVGGHIIADAQHVIWCSAGQEWVS